MKYKTLFSTLVSFLLILPIAFSAPENFTAWWHFPFFGDSTETDSSVGGTSTICYALNISSSNILSSADTIYINLTQHGSYPLHANHSICEMEDETTNCVVGTMSNFTWGGLVDYTLPSGSGSVTSDKLTYDFDSSKDYIYRICIQGGDVLHTDGLVLWTGDVGTENMKNSADVTGVKNEDEDWNTAWEYDNQVAIWNIIGESTTGEFTITAQDEYDSSTIDEYFNVTIYNSTDTYFNETNSGTITFDNLTGLYNINISTNYSSGYFTKTYLDINVSSDLQANLTQSYLSLNVTDLLTSLGLSSYTIHTNYSTYEKTDGYTILPTKSGYHVFNITSSQYPLHEFSYSIGALENLSFIANISPQFNFYLRREADNSIFDISGTNTTKLTIYCPEKSIVVDFKNNSAESKNSTQENVTMDCQYTYMKIDVSYGDSSYFRTLIPPTTQQNVTWWLLDLNLDTGVQKILELIDLTGEWTNGLIRIRRSIGSNIENMIEQYFDVSTSVTLYLLKDAIYTIVLQNNDATEERQLGTLIVDTAGTVTITYPNIPFYPDETILEDNISWSYTCPFIQCNPPYNTSDSILRLHYVDTTSNTDSVTWTVYNGTNTTKIFQTFTSTSSDVTFTYQPVKNNITYITKLLVQHSLLDFNITDTKVFGNIIEESLPGYTKEEESNIKKYAAGIFIIIWGLLFSAYHSGIGLGSAFAFALIFKAKGWIDINYIWLSLMGFIAVVAFIYEIMKKD